MTNLKAVLSQHQFKELTLLTSQVTLNHEITSVEVSETPDVSLYISNNVFLLTTAMVYQDDPQELKTLIQSLKSVQAAGIGIKVGRFIQKIPQEVIDYANSINFAIIEIPVTYPLGAVLHRMLDFVWNKQQEQLVSAIEIQRKFSDLLINDVPTERFIGELSKMLRVPIVLLNPLYDIVATSFHFNSTTYRAEFFVEQMLLKSPRANKSICHSFILQDFQNNNISVSMCSVNVNDLYPYHLLVFYPEKMPYPLSEVAIEQATMVLSFMLFKNQKIDEYIQDRQSGHFRHFIRQQKDESAKNKNWLQLGERFGLVASNHYQVVFVNRVGDDDFYNKVLLRTAEIHLLTRWLTAKLESHLPNTCIFHHKSRKYLILLIQHENENITELFKQIAKELYDKIGVSLAFSFGKVCHQMASIGTSFLEAKLTYDKVRYHVPQPIIAQYNHFYNAQDILGLFEQFDNDKVVYFCQTILKELAFPEDEYFKELRDTLKVYLDHQCEISSTAKYLFVHRNTVKYRIERCEEMLQYEFKDPKVSLNLRLALELSEKYVEKD